MIGALVLAAVTACSVDVASTSVALEAEGRPEAHTTRLIEQFLGEVQAGRHAGAQALMSEPARRVIGPAILKAYVASRQRALGEITGFGKARPFKEQYQAELRFEKGTATAWFIVVEDGIEWFAVEVPNGTIVLLDETEVLPVAKDMLTMAQQIGVGALTDFVSDEMLKEVGQEREPVHETMYKIGEVLGPLQRYELAQPTELQNACREVAGTGTFEHGKAALKLHVCWNDGIWGLRHALITPDVTPAMVERMFAKLIDGAPKATCPRDVSFPVGGEITCRVEMAGSAPQDARIKRTSEGGWKIVGLSDAK